MKKLVFLIVLMGLSFLLPAQKKNLDYRAIENWPTISSQKISNNGQYIEYLLHSSQRDELVVKATDNSWEKTIPLSGNRRDLFFTDDSHWLIFTRSDNSGAVLELGKEDVRYFDHISSFGMAKERNGEWLIYRLDNDSTNSLVLYNLYSSQEKRIPKVSNYSVSDNGQIIVIQQVSQSVSGSQSDAIVWIDLQSGQPFMLAKGHKAVNFVFDAKGTQLILMVQDELHSQVVKELFYYKIGMDSAKLLVNDSSAGMKGMQVELSNGYVEYSPSTDIGAKKYRQWPMFSKDGSKFYFFIKKSPSFPTSTIHDTLLAHVDIWNYKDKFLQSQQLEMLPDRNFSAVINLENQNGVVQLEKEADYGPLEMTVTGNEEYVVIFSEVEGGAREFWLESSRPNVYLVSTKDGTRRLIKRRLFQEWLQFSPSGKYLIWYDRIDRKWYSYNISTAVIKDISMGIPVFNSVHDIPGIGISEGMAGWLENEQGVLLYDRYDIWKVDPDAMRKPVNITGGFGRKNDVILRYIAFENELTNSISLRDTLLLSGFNTINKDRGFFIMPLASSGIPEKLIMGPYAWQFYPAAGNEFLGANRYEKFFLKAKYKKTYLLPRMTDTSYPNLYLSHDFRSFQPVSSLSPQKEYNWYTNELIRWIMPNGHIGEGILFKPENFNPGKKYPIIFYYYEKDADALNLFLNPELCKGSMNIPWYVSNGYLVCVPDIYYTFGHPGESAYNAVASAANFLAKKPWVDAQRMGLQGKSFGGFETNYIVTRTNLFAAAAPSAGATELVSQYGMLFSGASGHFFYENGQGRIGASLWEKPEWYIENSPIFKANKVTTPMLLLNNKEDNAIIWTTQAAPWFIALRRLGKKVWMLQYDAEGHSLVNPTDQMDYSVRLNQFFDHFLKGTPAPKWMTQGVPASKKGIDSGFELDTTAELPRK